LYIIFPFKISKEIINKIYEPRRGMSKGFFNRNYVGSHNEINGNRIIKRKFIYTIVEFYLT